MTTETKPRRPVRRTVDLTALQAVDPRRAYSCRQLASILGRTLRWAQKQAQRLAADGKAAKRGADYQIPGQSILDLAGDAITLCPPASAVA